MINPPILTVPPINLNNLSDVIEFGENLSGTNKCPAIEYFVAQAKESVISCSSG